MRVVVDMEDPWRRKRNDDAIHSLAVRKKLTKTKGLFHSKRFRWVHSIKEIIPRYVNIMPNGNMENQSVGILFVPTYMPIENQLLMLD